jgi:CRP-like cAMP-binding protein
LGWPEEDMAEASMPDQFTALGSNRLLQLLPPSERAELSPYLEPVELAQHQVLYEPYQHIAAVHFLLSGIVSLVAVEDRQIEVATVGNEGIAGMAVFLDANRTPFRGICQIAGQALRLSAPLLEYASDRLPGLRLVLHRYTQALLVQMGQSAACNLLHPIDQRCARWLLLSHDRMAGGELPLTQEFLSQMLGVGRGTVNAALQRLADDGLVKYRWGTLHVVDRAGLEKLVCRCYRTIRSEYDAVLGSLDEGTG